MEPNMRIHNKMKPVVFVDMFAGAGGLSEGLSMAGLVPALHVESNHSACLTLQSREIYRHLHAIGHITLWNNYLARSIERDELLAKAGLDRNNSAVMCENISEESESRIFDRIDRRLTDLGASELDVLAGGPPCQPFSIIGRHCNGKKDDDDRLWLFRHFVHALEQYKPKCFMFENVPGLLSMKDGRFAREIAESFDNAGYNSVTDIVDASNYGVLQHRRRLIIIGSRKDLQPDIQFPLKQPGLALVGDLLSDLPPVAPGEDGSDKGYYGPPSAYLEKQGIRTDTDELSQHEARFQNERDREIYRMVARLWLSKQERMRCNALPVELRPQRSCECFRDRFKVVAPDLPASHTVIAHISKDGHYYIHPDITQARSLTVREAARIQSFPDSYFFEGGRQAAFRQIGNAVPPLLAKAFGIVLRGYVEQANPTLVSIPA